jgi:hypothetical protein
VLECDGTKLIIAHAPAGVPTGKAPDHPLQRKVEEVSRKL